MERLEQTGETHIINGETVKARKLTNNKWFETQDSISYWDDFSKPKILWKRIGSLLRFCYDDNLALGLDSTCFATGRNIEYICCVLNSPMGHYLLKDAPKTGTGDLLISVQAIIPIMVPIISNNINSIFSKALKLLINDKNTDIEKEISHRIFDLYGLSTEEQLYIIENFS